MWSGTDIFFEIMTSHCPLHHCKLELYMYWCWVLYFCVCVAYFLFGSLYTIANWNFIWHVVWILIKRLALSLIIHYCHHRLALFYRNLLTDLFCYYRFQDMSMLKFGLILRKSWMKTLKRSLKTWWKNWQSKIHVWRSTSMSSTSRQKHK